MILKYRRFIFDVLLNVFATAVPIIVLQIIVLPYLARYMGNNQYGKMLTLISVVTVISGTFGNSLNNIRLIKNNEYGNIGFYGDFSVLLIIEVTLSFFLIAVISVGYSISAIDILLLGFMACLWTVREYIIVLFRINLDFKAIVINNIIMVIGYVLGLSVFIYTQKWQIIYILGILFSIIYVLYKDNSFIAPIAKSHIFHKTTKDLLFLIFAGLISNLLGYADRMMIFPLLGGTAVSIYYASALFGKMTGMAVTPLSGVILSYISKKRAIQRDYIFRIIGITSAIAVVGYILCRIVARVLLNRLYPDLSEEAMAYVPIMTVSAMIAMVSSVITPFVLKFGKLKWQLIINSFSLIIFVIVSLLLCRILGLMGFCYGLLVSNIVKVVFLSLLGFRMAEVVDK